MEPHVPSILILELCSTVPLGKLYEYEFIEKGSSRHKSKYAAATFIYFKNTLPINLI